MKKRMVVLLLVMIMISGLCVNAMATERASQIKPKLSFSGKTANCSVTVVEAGKLDVTLELWNGSEMVDSWSDSGTNYLNVSGSHAAVSGTTYTLIAHGRFKYRGNGFCCKERNNALGFVFFESLFLRQLYGGNG